MPIDKDLFDGVKGPEGTEYAALPRDVYQAEVMNVEIVEGKKYQSEELENQIKFTFVVIDEGEHYGRRLWRYATMKLSGGKKPSNLYTVLSGLNNKQFTKEECDNAAEIITADYLNSFTGKQVRLSVGQKVTEQGKTINPIESYLAVKAQLPPYEKKSEDIKKPF